MARIDDAGETRSPAARRADAGIEQRERSRLSDFQSFLAMVAIGIAYIALGVAVPEALFSWFEGAAFLAVGMLVLSRLGNRGQ